MSTPRRPWPRSRAAPITATGRASASTDTAGKGTRRLLVSPVITVVLAFKSGPRHSEIDLECPPEFRRRTDAYDSGQRLARNSHFARIDSARRVLEVGFGPSDLTLRASKGLVVTWFSSPP